jgi:hypothetical protein
MGPKLRYPPVLVCVRTKSLRKKDGRSRKRGASRSDTHAAIQAFGHMYLVVPNVFSICTRAYAGAQRPGLPRQSFTRPLLVHAMWRKRMVSPMYAHVSMRNRNLRSGALVAACVCVCMCRVHGLHVLLQSGDVLSCPALPDRLLPKLRLLHYKIV